MKILHTILACVLLASTWLTAAPSTRAIIPLAADYDLDSTSYIYVRTVGESRLPLGNAITRDVRVKTTGSSTSITAVTASSAPFAFNTAPPTGGGGDILIFDLKGQPDAASPANIYDTTRLTQRAILTRADADNVTVDTAIDLTNGATFFTRLFQSGTAAADGWIDVAGFGDATFAWQIQQSDGASVDVKVECRNVQAAAYVEQISTANVTVYGCPPASGSACSFTTLNPVVWDQCRLGFKITTDTSDAGATLEKISAQFVGQK